MNSRTHKPQPAKKRTSENITTKALVRRPKRETATAGAVTMKEAWAAAVILAHLEQHPKRSFSLQYVGPNRYLARLDDEDEADSGAFAHNPRAALVNLAEHVVPKTA